MRSLLFLLLVSGTSTLFFAPTLAWTPSSTHLAATGRGRGAIAQVQPQSSTALHVIPAAAASLLAGSIAGALGVGVAYPLDTIKTKSQVLAASQTEMTTKTAVSLLEQKKDHDALVLDMTSSSSSSSTTSKPLVDFGDLGDYVTTAAADSSAVGRLSMTGAALVAVPTAGASMVQVARYIYQTSGIAGFFAGVQTSMMGQAIIKAVVFAVNAAVLQYSQEHHLFGDDVALQLLTAAALAGFVTSFLAAPVDRIKVLMQCADHECYRGDEGQCMDAVLQQEGWKGLLGRGLGCTMLREVPAYSLYFGVYGGLQAYCTDLSAFLGPTLTPALYGAAAGMACWLPIYPIDVIRTVALNTVGTDENDENNQSPWEMAVELYRTAGIEAFYDGLGARLLRQAVNHAVTFSVYEILMKVALFQQPDVFA